MKVNIVFKRPTREACDSEPVDPNPGDEAKADTPSVGEIADATGISKGKGPTGITACNNVKTGFKSYGLGYYRYTGLSVINGTILR